MANLFIREVGFLCATLHSSLYRAEEQTQDTALLGAEGKEQHL